MSLCSRCEKVVQTVIEWDQDRGASLELSDGQKPEELVELEHCTDPTMFQESLKSSCWMCNLAWNTDHGDTEKGSIPDVVPKVFGSICDDGVQLEFRARSERVLFSVQPRIELGFLGEDSGDEYGSKADFGYECVYDTGMCRQCFSEYTGMKPQHHSLGTANQWLQDCRANHYECWNQKETKQNFLAPQRASGPLGVSLGMLTHDDMVPARSSCMGEDSNYRGRLIDLGYDKLSSDEWRLIEVGGEGMDRYTYTTLSHRWASYEPLMLNVKTRADMLVRMPLSAMPANYQDAVRITKALGVRYLWIDTLCVFQDDELDIQDAACNMAQVYSGSVCNVAVMTTRPSGMLSTQGLPGSPDSITYCKQQSGYRKCYYISHDSVWHREVATMPLYKRGWIAQEQILPSRQLLCGQTRFFWSCRTLTKYETTENNVWERNSSQGWAAQMRLVQMLAPGTEWHSGGELWYKFVNQYTERDLTNTQDKLLAVCGIAKFLQVKTLGLYMAGLWEGDLPNSLLWQIEKPPATTAVPSAYRAPSWSWASVEGKICYTPPHWVVAQYLEGWVRTKNGSNFGFVAPDAYMGVRGPFFSLKENGRSDDGRFSLVDYDDYPVSVDLDHRPIFHERLPYFHLLVMDVEESHIEYGFRGLLLQRVKPSRLLGKNFRDVKCSILVDPAKAEVDFRKRPLGPNMYERIGLVKASTTQAFARDGSLVEGGGAGRGSSRKSTLFGSMLQRVRTAQQYRPEPERSYSADFENRQLDSYWKDVVII